MSIFITSKEQKYTVIKIKSAMKKSGVDFNLIEKCVTHAFENEGTHDLMVLWYESNSDEEKTEILQCLKNEVF